MLLVGCAVTPADVRETGNRFSAEVAAPPATAYRELVTRMRECYSDKAWKIDADYFPDQQTARVTFGLTRASITMAILTLARSGNGTSMEVSYYGSLSKEWRDSFVAWARGEPGYCVADAVRKPPSVDPRPQR